METEPTRISLIEKVKSQHNDEAWKLFEEAYKHYIKAVVLKLGVSPNDASDLKQDILVKLWKKLPKFDYEPERGKFRTWLYEVVKNHVFDHLNSKRTKNERKNRALDDWKSPSTDSEIKRVMDKEWKAYVTSLAMKRIKDKFSTQNLEIFNRLLRGENPRALAEEYGVKSNSISKVKNRIKERLIVEIAEVRSELE